MGYVDPLILETLLVLGVETRLKSFVGADCKQRKPEKTCDDASGPIQQYEILLLAWKIYHNFTI